MNNSSSEFRRLISDLSKLTCAECPFATPLDTNRYRCEETHRIGLEVVRGHWKTNIDCLLPITEKLGEMK